MRLSSVCLCSLKLLMSMLSKHKVKFLKSDQHLHNMVRAYNVSKCHKNFVLKNMLSIRVRNFSARNEPQILKKIFIIFVPKSPTPSWLCSVKITKIQKIENLTLGQQQGWANLDQASKHLEVFRFRDLSPTPIP